MDELEEVADTYNKYPEVNQGISQQQVNLSAASFGVKPEEHVVIMKESVFEVFNQELSKEKPSLEENLESALEI